MKSFLMISMCLLISGLSFAEEETDKIVASCEDKYQILYDGETSGYFAGVLAKHSVFYIRETDGAKVESVIDINTEGGRIVAESIEKYDDKSGKALETKQMIYEEGWGQKSMTISLNGKVVEKLSCKNVE